MGRYAFSSSQLATDPYFAETSYSTEDWLAPTEVQLNGATCDLETDLPILDIATIIDTPTMCAQPHPGSHQTSIACLVTCHHH